MNKLIINLHILLVFLAVPSISLSQQNQPNLLIIMTDEHNFRTIGAYRDLLPKEQAFVWGKGVEVKTPNIDSLADEGALLTSYYATTPLCSPARASFMSGLYPHAAGMPVNNRSLNDDLVTFAEVLQKEGYATGYFGKWHLDGEAKPGWAPERKFGWEDNKYMFNRGHWKNLIDTPNGPKVNTSISKKNKMPTYELGDADENSFTTDFLTNKTLGFIEKNKNKPFVAMLSIPDPHQPDVVRKPYDTMYSHFTYQSPQTMFKNKEQTPNWIIGNKHDEIPDQKLNQKGMSNYFGMVRLIDDNIGKLLYFLVKNNLDKNTIVIFTSDHGDLLGEHARHNKRLPYEGSAICPLIVRYPDKIKQGKLIHSAMNSADFAPTILSLMESKQSIKKVHGRDLSDQFLNNETNIRDKKVSYMRGVMGPTGESVYWLAAFNDRYKFVISKEEQPWLIDLQKDPNEVKNFYNTPGTEKITKHLKKELKQLLKKTNDPALNDDKIAHWLN